MGSNPSPSEKDGSSSGRALMYYFFDEKTKEPKGSYFFADNFIIDS